MSIFLEENWNIQEKRSGMKKLWKRFRLHFAIPTRQRDKEIMKRNIRNGEIRTQTGLCHFHQAKK
jgi:hypothetical protein